MILVKTKAESVATSPLSLGSIKGEKPTLSFSELLRGAKDSKGEKEIQNGSFVLSLGSKEKELVVLKDIKAGKESALIKVKEDVKPSSKNETLSSLLKNDDKVIKKEEIPTLELNPKITQQMSVTELKALIADAKKYLKNKILDSVEYKKAEIKDLPQTLKGLVDVAKKFGIDVSKISLEEVRDTIKPTAKPLAKELSETISKNDAKSALSPQPEKILSKLKEKDLKTDLKTEQKSTEIDTKQSAKKVDVSAVDSDVQDIVEVKIKATKVKAPKIDQDQDLAQELRLKKEDIKESIKDNIRIDEKKTEVLREVKATPLFKAKEKLEHTTTEQLVQTKQIKVEEKTPKTRADETLKLLLRGEKPSAQNIDLGLTKEFSVATARVIAPELKSETSKSIEQLLRGDVSEDLVKSDVTSAKDVDSFELKVKEAKQMIRYLSQDVKSAIENYKSPFTRVKVQLNPQKMGEVDLTVVQRGNNLHVNLSSNNAAINTLAMNLNDLRVQLNNNGIQNATFNFNDSSQSAEQQHSQQRERHNERRADEEYKYFENEEQNEEILSSLEIVVPHYA